MATRFHARVKETTTTTGTGTLTLAGAVTGFRSFAIVGDGNKCYCCIEDGTAWEETLGTYTASGTTLARASFPYASSSTTTGSITATTGNAVTPIVVTSNGHGLSVGQYVEIQGVVGNTTTNGYWRISAQDTNTFTLEGSCGNGTYTSGGTWTAFAKVSFSAGTKNVYLVHPANMYDFTGQGSVLFHGPMAALEVRSPNYASAGRGWAALKASVGPGGSFDNPVTGDAVAAYFFAKSDVAGGLDQVWACNPIVNSDDAGEVWAVEANVNNGNANAPDPYSAGHKLGVDIVAGGTFRNSAALSISSSSASSPDNRWKHGIWAQNVGGATDSELFHVGANVSVKYGINFKAGSYTDGVERYPNNSGLLARNAADGADVGLVKLDGSDHVLLGYSGTSGGTAVKWVKTGHTGGNATVVDITQSTANTTDTGDVGLFVSYNISATNSNELVIRAFKLLVATNLTNSKTLSDMRCFELTVDTNTSTTTTTVVGYWFGTEGTAAGTVTNMHGGLISDYHNSGATVTSKSGWSIDNQTGATNNTQLLLGTTTIPSGTFAIYSSSSSNSYFAGKVMGPGTEVALVMGRAGTIPASTANDQADAYVVVPFDLTLLRLKVTCVTKPSGDTTIQVRRSTDSGNSFSNAFGTVVITASGTAKMFTSDPANLDVSEGDVLNFSITGGGGSGTNVLVTVIGHKR